LFDVASRSAILTFPEGPWATVQTPLASRTKMRPVKLVAALLLALWVPLCAAAPTDYFAQRIPRPATVAPPGRVLPQHSFFFGTPAYWPQGLHWRYNSADAPGQLGGNESATVQLIADAAAKWTAVCGVRIIYDGETSTVPRTVVNGSPDGVSVVGWQDPGFGVQAATNVWSDVAANGDSVLIDSDVVLSPGTVTTPALLASVITHEWGHAIGLGHSPVANTLMSGPPDTAYSSLTDLTPDDVQGCRCLYGLPAATQEGFICSLPSKLDFGSVTVGTNSTPTQIIVTNDGTASLTMGSLQMQGGDFSFSSSGCAFGMTLAPGASCSFTIVASPTVAEFRQAEAIINTSGGPYRIPLSAQGIPAPPPTLNFEGAWWNAPADSESGWGLTLAHQDDVVFATWFTYDASHRAMWLSMTAFRNGTSNTFNGLLYRATGPSLATEPFDPTQVQRDQVGTGSLAFGNTDNGSFTYTVNGIAQSKSITRLAFGPLPTCTFSSPTNPVLSTNYQGNWWEASGTESGWGIYFTHQGDTIFVSWFTYDVDGSPMWLSATAARTANGDYHGDIVRTTGPPFSAMPFPSQDVTRTTIGALTLTFANGNNASFAYSVMIGTPPSSISRTKTLTRLVFRPPGTLCE